MRQATVVSIRILVFSLASLGLFMPATLYGAAQVQTTGAALLSKVAPGEFLPISVRMTNLGGSNRVDVIVSYLITDAQGTIIYSSQETVAVETTASFVKTIQIPFDATPGRYTAKSSIAYPDQVSPATSEFPFIVERKILGLYQSDFYLYGSVVLLFGVIAWFVSRLWIKHRRPMRITPVDYSDISGDQRVFYELISDTIMGMRQQVGQRALDIANGIDGLTIDKKTGRVIKLTQKPSKIIADLVLGYEKELGKNVSFSFRRK